jgi:hypothetical protein
MKRKNKLAIAIATAAFAALGGMAVYAQDKYALKTPRGSPSPTSRDTRTGRWFLPRGPTKCSR